MSHERARDVCALKRSIAGGVREVLDHSVRYQRERRSRACPGLPGGLSGLEALQVLQKARVRRLPAERLPGMGTGRGLVDRPRAAVAGRGAAEQSIPLAPPPPGRPPANPLTARPGQRLVFLAVT